MSDTDLAVLRAAYARQMLAQWGLDDPRVEAAFAAVPREEFLGTAPWTLLDTRAGPLVLAENDPRLVYQDVLVALDEEKGINNGSPSLHAMMMHALGVAPGDRVLHLGAGTGYYSAILAELAGPAGEVVAVEYDPDLAARAAQSLREWSNVRVHRGDAAAFPETDVARIYVNFAVADLPDRWLDHLTDGGTLVFPLGVPRPEARGAAQKHSARGAAVAVTRRGATFAARHLCPVAFICAEGELAGDAALRRQVFEAFETGGADFVRSLHRPGPPERCFVWTPRWSLSYDAA